MTTLAAGLSAAAQTLLDVVAILRENDQDALVADTHVGAQVYGFDDEDRGTELQVHDADKATALAALFHLGEPSDSDGDAWKHRRWTGTVGHDQHTLHLATTLPKSSS